MTHFSTMQHLTDFRYHILRIFRVWLIDALFVY